MQQRLIFHVDVNSAFLSWEAARRVAAGEPDLRAIPSAIGGDRDKRTGIILAKSIPAKKFGVTTGEPVGMALRKCPQLVLAPPDFALYTRNSRAFIAICRRFAPVVEQVSIDECFLDMTGTHLLYPDPLAVAHQIKDAIFSELGFTVNVGISENKLLAKMASDFEKPDKVHTLFPTEIPQKLWPLPVGDLLSVGRALAEKLTAARIRTIGDLARTDLAYLQKLTGVRTAALLHDYACGVDPSPVLAEPEAVKCYGNSTTLEQDVTTIPQANQVLLALCDSVAARLRADGRRCLAKSLFAEFWDGRPLRLLGVTLSDLTDGQTQQLSLFPDEKRDRARKLDQAVDQLRGKFGPAAISRGPLTPTTHRLHRKFTPKPPDTLDQ